VKAGYRNLRVLLVAAILGSTLLQNATAQSFNPDSLNIPVTHPRLLFSSADDLTRARSWYATNPITAPSGSAIHQAFVGLMTQSASHCATAINLVMNSTDYQLSAQLESAVASDAARWIGEEAIVTYD
jgi:hypothetical protein